MRQDHVRLAGERVVLRPLTPADLPLLWRWNADPELNRLTGDKFARWRDPRAWLVHLLRSPRRLGFAVETHQGRVIGDLELEDIDWRRGTAELRVCIGEKDCWGKGYGSDAVRVAARHALGSLGLRTLYLRVLRRNRRAIRCYGRCGFRCEAVLRAGRRRRQGWDDLLLMTLTPAAAGLTPASRAAKFSNTSAFPGDDGEE
ncbi:MAG: GNAT family N-acetyltransferase [Thermaerobacter sp.]|nr:N-acetyltransferase [Bacillota bacterium]REJ38181.1 MAG: N-acetyltransferase [Bacillota bacterium]